MFLKDKRKIEMTIHAHNWRLNMWRHLIILIANTYLNDTIVNLYKNNFFF